MKFRSAIAFVLIGLAAGIVHAEGFNLPPIGGQPYILTPPDNKREPLYEGSYALVMSVAQYAHWPKLPSAAPELDKVAEALRKNGFLVRRVKDPDSNELWKEVKDFFETYGREANSRVVVYYGGHAYYDETTNTGYLVPRDSKLPGEKSDVRLKSTPFEDVRNAAMRMPAKHGLFVFDNCYSGVVFQSRNSGVVPTPEARGEDRWRTLRGYASRKGRQFLSAGDEKQLVPGISLVAPAFVNAISGGAASRSRDGYVTAGELAYFIQAAATTRTQQPMMSPLGGHTGDMVFQPVVLTPPALPAIAATPPRKMRRVTAAADAHFDFDKTGLKIEGRAKLVDLIDRFKDSTIEVVIVVGHTDNTEAMNEDQRLALTELRARKVQDFFVERGVARERIYVEAKGSSQPVADNRTREGRAKNRRVEIEVLALRPVD